MGEAGVGGGGGVPAAVGDGAGVGEGGVAEGEGAGAADGAALKILRDRYREGIPRRPIADEEADARILYRVLATIGGAELVGPGRELDAGTFYRAIPGS